MIALDEPRQRELAGLRLQMALSSFFDQLTVLDRDALPAAPDPRQEVIR